MRWSLYHRGRDGVPWRTAYSAEAPAKTDLRRWPWTGSERRKPSRLMPTWPHSLARSAACFVVYVSHKTAGENLKWSSQIDKFRANYRDTKSIREQLGNAESVRVHVEVQSRPHWTCLADEGRRSPRCMCRRELGHRRHGLWTVAQVHDEWLGRHHEHPVEQVHRALDADVGAEGAADGKEISLAAQSSWPYEFEGTKYKGD